MGAKIKYINVSKSHYEHIEKIAKKYFDLEKRISDFYFDEDDNDPLESGKPPINEGDLCDIGEIAAREFGLM